MNTIEARHLGKVYYVQGTQAPTLLSTLTLLGSRRKKRLIWALKDVSFDIEKGETVGIIGPNGSGKSSALGLILGTTYPTTGTIKTYGRLSSLLELGAGFHSELTGRENIFLYGAILGIPRETIKRRFDHIVEFAGLREFLDMPVKYYSSGMYVRLAFAIAVEMDPDILLIDEVLAVGDIAFQAKCLSRIRNFQKSGKTIVIVSHNMQTIEQFCNRAFLLHQGQLVAHGEPSEVIFNYLQSYMGKTGYINTVEYGNRDVEIEDVQFINSSGRETHNFETGEAMTVKINYNAKKRINQPVFGFSIKADSGIHIFGSNTQLADYKIDSIEGKGAIRLLIKPLNLMQGNFFLSIAIHSSDHAIQYHRRDDWYPFVVKNMTGTLGLFHLNARWEHIVGSGL